MAGSWLVSKAGENAGTALDSFALVAPAQVSAVLVENFDGKQFVAASII